MRLRSLSDTTNEIRTLLVEADENDAQQTTRGLTAAMRPKFLVEHVTSLADALSRIEKNGDHLDVILLDLSLPDAEGVGAVMPLMSIHPRLPVVLFTGYEVDDVLIETFLALGVQDYVFKGTETEKSLQQSLRFAVERHRLLERIRKQRQDYEKLFASIREGDIDVIHSDDKEFKIQDLEVYEENKRFLKQIQRSNAELEQFAYVAAHDLQSPLRAIAAHCQMLKRNYQGKIDERADEHIEHATAGAVRMQALLDDLLEFSRVQTEDIKLEETDCNVVVDEALAMLAEPIETANAQIERGVLPTVWADSTNLVRLFQNLIGNAVKYAKEESPRVEILASEDVDYWQFAVRDNGIGIDPKYFDRIFNVFQRLHKRDDYPGTGVGLAICQKVVQLHGGKIWVESELDKGATFYFTIPSEKDFTVLGEKEESNE